MCGKTAVGWLVEKSHLCHLCINGMAEHQQIRAMSVQQMDDDETLEVISPLYLCRETAAFDVWKGRMMRFTAFRGRVQKEDSRQGLERLSECEK